jgi:hypothetical protein
MAIEFYSSIDLNKCELQNAALQNLASHPSTPVEGQVYYNTGDDQIKLYANSAWVALASGSVSSAADDITTGDGAVSIATSTGNVTIDSQAAELILDGHTGITLQNASGDILIDSAADIVLDAAGNDFSFKSADTEFLRVTNSTGDAIIKPIVDAKDIIFQQRDGDEVARIEDNGTFNVVADKLAINGTAITSTAAELNILAGVTSTAAELNILAGVNTSAAELNYVEGVTSNIQDQLDDKAPLASPTFTGTVGGITSAMVGLGSVDNTSDAGKPISTATQTALNAKAPLASPTFTGTVTIPSGASITAPTGLVKGDVGLGNVDNTSDVNKPVSTAGQAALDLKAPLESPTFTGTVTIPDLVVSGTTTTVNSTTVTLDDPIITLGGDTAPGSDDGKDRGVEFRWHDGTGAKTGFFGFDDSSGYFGFIPNATGTGEVFTGTLGDFQATNFRGDLIGNADTATTVTTNADLTGDITSSGNVTVIASGVIVNEDINASAGIADTKLATISTTGKVSNSATTATSANTASAIVARDASGDFSARTITAALTGNAATATKIASIINDNIVQLTATQTLTNKTLTAPILGTPQSGDLSNCTVASASAKGVVELALAAEVIAGTETAVVITPDTLAAKSVVAEIEASSLIDSLSATITHNLGTRDVIVQMYGADSDQTVYADVFRTTDDLSTSSDNVITIDFCKAPTENIKVLITSIKGATTGTIAYT